MKKTLLTALALGCVTLMLSSNAMALNIGPSSNNTEASLQTLLDVRTDSGTSSVTVEADMLSDINDSVWTMGDATTSSSTLLFELAGYANGTSFGIYDLNDTSNRLELFSGADTAPTSASMAYDSIEGTYTVGLNTISLGSSFGYYINVSDTTNTYYSYTGQNADGFDHMFAYQGVGDMFSVANDGIYDTWDTNEYILAWEDIYGGGDYDYQDFAVMVSNVEPVPEPATMLLFGTGIAGLMGAARRRKKQA